MMFYEPTTAPIDGNVSLNGNTTVTNSVIEVILSKPRTVPVNKQTGSAYMQVSGASRRRNSVFELGFALRFR
jgi:hypothetical protein